MKNTYGIAVSFDNFGTRTGYAVVFNGTKIDLFFPTLADSIDYVNRAKWVEAQEAQETK